MKLIQTFALAVGVLSSTPAMAQVTAWLCIADNALGFSKSSGSWAPARFTPGDKYVIRASQQQGVAWEVRLFGSQNPLADAICKQTFTSMKILNCTGILTEFHFNASTSRFIRTYLGGYWTYIPGDKMFGNDNSDTPYIEIGTCSAI